MLQVAREILIFTLGTREVLQIRVNPLAILSLDTQHVHNTTVTMRSHLRYQARSKRRVKATPLCEVTWLRRPSPSTHRSVTKSGLAPKCGNKTSEGAVSPIA